MHLPGIGPRSQQGAKDDQRKTPLHLLCENNPNEEVLIQTIQLFLEKRFDLRDCKKTLLDCYLLDYLQSNVGLQNKGKIENLLLIDE